MRNKAQKAKWDWEHYATASCRLPRPIWERFKAVAYKNGTCPNRVLIAAAMAYILDHREGPSTRGGIRNSWNAARDARFFPVEDPHRRPKDRCRATDR
jgi:hypothetical protein